MTHLGCMVTGNTVSLDQLTPVDETAIVVMRGGNVIGVVSPAAQEGVATMRMTFTRDKPDAQFVPLQGVAVQYFHHEHPDDAP